MQGPVEDTVDDVDHNTTEQTKVKRTKDITVTPVQNFPGYLKLVARRSKAGFDKVHDEIQRIRRDTMGSHSQSQKKLRHRWSINVKSSPLWSSTGSIKTSPGRFTSYIQEEDTQTEGITKELEKSRPSDKSVKGGNVNSSARHKTGPNSARQLKAESTVFDFNNTKLKMPPEVNGKEKNNTRDTAACQCDISNEQTICEHLYINQHDISNIEEDIYAVPGNPDPETDADTLEDSTEYVDMDNYHDIPGPKVYRSAPQVNRGNGKQVYSNLEECLPAEQEFDYVNCQKEIHTPVHIQHDSDSVNNHENGKPIIKSRIPNSGLEHVTETHARTLKPAVSNIKGPTNESKESFYNYSVDELVKCLNECALSRLACICEEEKLDGEYFKTTTKEDLEKEPFIMNWFYISKFFRVIDGWRPKHNA